MFKLCSRQTTSNGQVLSVPSLIPWAIPDSSALGNHEACDSVLNTLIEYHASSTRTFLCPRLTLDSRSLRCVSAQVDFTGTKMNDLSLRSGEACVPVSGRVLNQGKRRPGCG